MFLSALPVCGIAGDTTVGSASSLSRIIELARTVVVPALELGRLVEHLQPPQGYLMKKGWYYLNFDVSHGATIPQPLVPWLAVVGTVATIIV
jgi:hypothetical protein